jgi:hypothetical protein
MVVLEAARTATRSITITRAAIRASPATEDQVVQASAAHLKAPVA